MNSDSVDLALSHAAGRLRKALATSLARMNERANRALRGGQRGMGFNDPHLGIRRLCLVEYQRSVCHGVHKLG